jgi:hypothetical protein
MKPRPLSVSRSRRNVGVACRAPGVGAVLLRGAGRAVHRVLIRLLDGVAVRVLLWFAIPVLNSVSCSIWPRMPDASRARLSRGDLPLLRALEHLRLGVARLLLPALVRLLLHREVQTAAAHAARGGRLRERLALAARRLRGAEPLRLEPLPVRAREAASAPVLELRERLELRVAVGGRSPRFW